MENITFEISKKNIFGNKTTKVALSLCTQLGFQKHKKGKFSAIMAKVWNESHIVWEPFQTPFSTIKNLTRYIFKTHRNSTGKPKIH